MYSLASNAIKYALTQLREASIPLHKSDLTHLPEGITEGSSSQFMMIVELSGSLQWLAIALLIVIGLVSVGIVVTRKKFKEELDQLSEIEKDS